jgi:UDP-N-acetylmuramate--alanine ligase
MYAAFDQFGQRFEGGVLVACADQEGAAQMARRMAFPVTTYSIREKGGDFYATDILLAGRESQYTLHGPGGLCMGVELGVPGLHNVSNSLAAYAMAARLGTDIAALGTVLAQFRGVGRRFTSYELPGGVLVVDDYAHHATEVAATIRAARLVQERGTGGRIIAVFQPHRYSRISHLFDQFRVCFAGADVAFITDIYGAGEEPIPGVDGASLARHAGSTGVVEAIHVATPAEAAARARQMAHPGDMILFLGAGNITDAARALVAAEKGTQL